jgi:hypothetical protein
LNSRSGYPSLSKNTEKLKGVSRTQLNTKRQINISVIRKLAMLKLDLNFNFPVKMDFSNLGIVRRYSTVIEPIITRG